VKLSFTLTPARCRDGDTLLTQGHTWILNESLGLQSHAIAVAQAVGLPFDLKRLEVTGLLRRLPVWLQMQLSPARLLASVPSNEPFGASWPTLIIAIGRRSVPIALSLKSLSERPCFALQIRTRRGSECQFDLVAAPMNKAFNRAKAMATFDAVYNVAPMSHANDMRSFNDRLKSDSYESISDIDVVASVIRGVLSLEDAQA
jgi:mitochondrial fission protein ELM1